jgi:hypothetical protein
MMWGFHQEKPFTNCKLRESFGFKTLFERSMGFLLLSLGKEEASLV